MFKMNLLEVIEKQMCRYLAVFSAEEIEEEGEASLLLPVARARRGLRV